MVRPEGNWHWIEPGTGEIAASLGDSVYWGAHGWRAHGRSAEWGRPGRPMRQLP